MTPEEIRSQTYHLVAEYRPETDRDRLSRDEILDALRELVEPFSRDAQATHLTASAFIVGSRGTVLHRHKITGTWLQPGGHVDNGEAPWLAVLREVTEETGLVARHRDAARLFDVDCHDTPRGHRHLDLRWLLDAGDEDPVAGEGESPDVRWFSWDDAAVHADPTLIEVIPRARRWTPAVTARR